MNSLEIGSSINFELTLNNPLVGAVNNAVVTVRVEDLYTGTEMLASTNLIYVDGSDGIYRVTVDPIPNLVRERRYKAIYNAASDGLQATFFHELVATQATQ